jgi:acetyltransferase-like isoleucine patch superfamily enzyme
MLNLSVPVPRPVGHVILWIVGVARPVYQTAYRVFVCEPLFKAACRSYGRNVHTGVFVHYVAGTGEMHIGDDTLLDGKSSFSFAARFSDRPTLRIGSRTYVGHQCTFTVAMGVTLGDDCYVASGCMFMDSPGHPLDPGRRLAHLPPDPEQVRPIVVKNNVWVGSQAIIMPGVTVGEGSVVAARSVVTSDVPPYTVVGGTPARVLKRLDPVGDGALTGTPETTASATRG